MARPIKQGIDYFPLDVGFLDDIKVRRIMRSCGLQAVAILICLLGNIYKDEGYYMQWDEDISFLVADKVGTSDGAVIATVEKAVQVKFFDEELFRRYKILTSKGIQTRFLTAVARRKSIDIIPEYMLVEATAFVKSVNVCKNPVNVCSNEQRKVKKSKEKESNYLAEPEEENDEVFERLILKDNSLHPVTEKQVKEWIRLFPEVNVRQEIRNMVAWCRANPGKRKTEQGINRFINSWLIRANNRPKETSRNGSSRDAPKFEEREYSDEFFEQFAGISYIED